MDAPNQGKPTADAAEALLDQHLHGCRSLGELLARQAAATPSALAFSCAGEGLSFLQLDTFSTRLAAWLRQVAALAPGERVAVQLPNGLVYPTVAMAVFKAALVLVNISPRVAAAERLAMLRDSQARILFVQDKLAGGPLAELSAAGLRVLVNTGPGEEHPAIGRGPDPHATPERSGEKRKLWKAGLSRILARPVANETVSEAAAAPATLALLQYTGGSSGQLKAAMLSHGNLLANLAQLRERLGPGYPPAGSLMVAPLPFSHVYAFTLNLLAGVAHGHHTLVVPDSGNIEALLDTLAGRRFQGISGVDSLYRRLCEHPGFRRLDFSALRIASVGGMPLSAQVARDWQQLTGCPLTQGYGLTECSPLVCCSPAGACPPDSLGKPVAATGLCIRNGRGEILAAGEEGEICVKGPQLMRGYWRRPEENASAFDAAGWFRTGDSGMLDAAGNLRLCGRLKEMIIISGFKVYPREVEACALAHPAVADACALGYGPATRQQTALFVVCRAPLDARELRAWCRASLAAFKVPGRIEFVTHLPRSAAGKLQRQSLARLLAES